jgi:hypothetical protein
MSGNNWEDQLTSLKTILVDLSVNPNNRVSIIVFACNAITFCENREASSINVNAISYPGGGTDTPVAFRTANSIMNRYVGTMNLYYIYISDGEGPHPTIELE